MWKGAVIAAVVGVILIGGGLELWVFKVRMRAVSGGQPELMIRHRAAGGNETSNYNVVMINPRVKTSGWGGDLELWVSIKNGDTRNSFTGGFLDIKADSDYFSSSDYQITLEILPIPAGKTIESHAKLPCMIDPQNAHRSDMIPRKITLQLYGKSVDRIMLSQHTIDLTVSLWSQKPLNDLCKYPNPERRIVVAVLGDQGACKTTFCVNAKRHMDPDWTSKSYLPKGPDAGIDNKACTKRVSSYPVGDCFMLIDGPGGYETKAGGLTADEYLDAILNGTYSANASWTPFENNGRSDWAERNKSLDVGPPDVVLVFVTAASIETGEKSDVGISKLQRLIDRKKMLANTTSVVVVITQADSGYPELRRNPLDASHTGLQNLTKKLSEKLNNFNTRQITYLVTYNEERKIDHGFELMIWELLEFIEEEQIKIRLEVPRTKNWLERVEGLLGDTSPLASAVNVASDPKASYGAVFSLLANIWLSPSKRPFSIMGIMVIIAWNVVARLV